MALFELVDSTGGPPPPGPWRVAPGGHEGLAFGAAAVAPASPVWRADLPDDRVAALAALAAAEADLRRQDAALDAAPGRMIAVAAPATASYGLRGQPAGLGAPDHWLRATVEGLRAGSGSPAGAASYGLRDDVTAAWQEAEARFLSFAAQAREALSSLAVVETRVGGALVARTSVGWSGDFRTLLGGAPLYLDAALHRRTLGLALGSRAALLKMFGTVMRGAAIVAALTSSPVGAALALPAAWRFVEQVRDELLAPA